MTELQKQPPEWTEKLETAVLVGMIVINLIVTLLDFLGVLDEIKWLSDRVPILILLSTVAIAAYLLLERRNQLKTMQDETSQRLEQLAQNITTSTSTIIQSLDGIEVRQFDAVHELLQYLNIRLLHTKKQVDDLSWSAERHLGGNLPATQEAYMKYKQVVAQTAHEKMFREVYMFNRSHRTEQLKEYLTQDSSGYSCAYYPVTDVPLMQFMVIDQEEAIILMDASSTYLSIKHAGLVKLFSDYYDSIWAKSIKLKEGRKIRLDAVEALSQELQVALV